jgi:5-formaminoimidazole-4-carboxamide-1-beta-D-ribofuranosyl 5'-monophosphate synthetase
MQWYTAICIFRCIVAGEKKRRSRVLFERRYLLLKANSDEAAVRRAGYFAKKRQHTYRNAKGQSVKWVLEKILDVKEVISKDLIEGTEVYHEYFYKRASATVDV